MKISGKFILKVAGTLTVISLVVAALLGLVDNVTADKIAAIDAENTRIAMSAVVPEAASSPTSWISPRPWPLPRPPRAVRCPSCTASPTAALRPAML